MGAIVYTVCVGGRNSCVGKSAERAKKQVYQVDREQAPAGTGGAEMRPQH